MSDIIKNPTIYRKTLTVAGTEYSQVLTATQPLRITISADDLTSQILFSFTALGSTTGKRIFQGSEWVSPGFVRGSKTIYAQSPNAGAIMVIEEWTKD